MRMHAHFSCIYTNSYFTSTSGFVNIIYEFLILFLKSVALLHVRLRTSVNACTAADIQISEKL